MGKGFFLSAVLSKAVSNSGPKTKFLVKGTLHKRILEAVSPHPVFIQTDLLAATESAVDSVEASDMNPVILNSTGKDFISSHLVVPATKCSCSCDNQNSRFLVMYVVASAGFQLAIAASQALFKTMSVLLSIRSFKSSISSKSDCFDTLDSGASSLGFLLQTASWFSSKGNLLF